MLVSVISKPYFAKIVRATTLKTIKTIIITPSMRVASNRVVNEALSIKFLTIIKKFVAYLFMNASMNEDVSIVKNSNSALTIQISDRRNVLSTGISLKFSENSEIYASTIKSICYTNGSKAL